MGTTVARVRAGQASRYHPYIMTMPETPSCGFLMDDETAKRELTTYFGEAGVGKGLQALYIAKQEYTSVRSYVAWPGSVA
jgi:hypothetical protein